MSQVALAWVLSRGDDVVPIPGTKRRKYLEENVGAVDVTLDERDIARLEGGFPPGVAAGFRYPEAQLKTHLDIPFPPLQGRADSDAAAAEPGGVMARSAIFGAGVTPPRSLRDSALP